LIIFVGGTSGSCTRSSMTNLKELQVIRLLPPSLPACLPACLPPSLPPSIFNDNLKELQVIREIRSGKVWFVSC
jgi:hypothetical protein